MKTGNQEKIKNVKKSFDLKLFRRFLVSLFGERFKILAFLIVLGYLFSLIFLWYTYIFQSDWSEAEVQNYILSKQSQSDVIFSRDSFQKIIDESKNRNGEFEKSLNDMQDIFRLRR